MNQDYNKTKSIILNFLTAFAAGLFALLSLSLAWEEDNWANLKLNELIIQLATAKDTAGYILKSFALHCALPAVLTLIAVFFTLAVLQKKEVIKVKTLKLVRKLIVLAAITGILVTAVIAFIHMDAASFIKAKISESEYTNYIDDNYVDPNSVSITFPEKKRNIIYLWLESMEITYSDEENGGNFSENVIPELTQLAHDNICFSGSDEILNGAYAMYGSTWTAAAMFGHTSGLPLKIPVTNGSMGWQNFFFPGATTLGDILEKEGYTQALFLGSSAEFGGRELYFSQHGNFFMYDHPYFAENGEIPKDYNVWWGMEDEYLFKCAKKHILELAESGQPFNASILTVDTHFPDGYVCNLCEDKYENQYSNVMACSSKQVLEFVNWIKEQDFYENTTVIIAGDHLTMDVKFSEMIDDDYDRKVYVCILNPAEGLEEYNVERSYSTYDLFPTALAAMGAKIEGNKLALGTNLFSDEKTLVERDGVEKMNLGLAAESNILNSLSGIDEEVYELASRLKSINPQMSAQFNDENNSVELTFKFGNVLDGIEEAVEYFEVHAEYMNYAWGIAEKQEDNTYKIEFSYDDLKQLDSYTMHIYAMTDAGRITVGKNYVYKLDPNNKTFTAEYSAE